MGTTKVIATELSFQQWNQEQTKSWSVFMADCDDNSQNVNLGQGSHSKELDTLIEGGQIRGVTYTQDSLGENSGVVLFSFMVGNDLMKGSFRED